MCPCGSGVDYSSCCEPLHDGTVEAQRAEQVMRARYSAYAKGMADYLFRTWHPRTRPDDVTLEPDLTWTGLQVTDVVAGGMDDEQGEVEFVAHFRAPDGEGVLRERSSFVRRGNRWVYVDGTQYP